jgi:hypothetical protein
MCRSRVRVISIHPFIHVFIHSSIRRSIINPWDAVAATIIITDAYLDKKRRLYQLAWWCNQIRLDEARKFDSHDLKNLDQL